MRRPGFIAEKIGIALIALVVIAVALLGFYSRHINTTGLAEAKPPLLPSSDDPRLIYSNDPADPWNRIFHSLFTRTVRTRLSDNFPEGAPFTRLRDGGISGSSVSTKTFERSENGDRPIDPLYPSFLTDDGVLGILDEAGYSELKSALIDALAEKDHRPSTSRALMQSDVWAAYDILFSRKRFSTTGDAPLIQRKDDLLSLLGRFARKLVLTQEEIASLPENYKDASVRYNLPNAFSANSQWLEVQMHPNRMHDVAADFRRSARVFLKPAGTSVDRNNLLETLRRGEFFPVIDSLALVIQDLLIDSNGNARPTHLTAEVQIRNFVKDASGRLIRTELHQYEFNRRSFLRAPGEGGLVEIDKNADLYLPAAGNDYQFASPQLTSTGRGYPVLVSLRQRCEGCHGRGATGIFTFSTHDALPLPPITFLPVSGDVHGWYVAGRKQEREDFKALWRQR